MPFHSDLFKQADDPDLVALFQVDDMNETDPVIEQTARTDAISGSQLSPMNLSFTPTP